MLVPLNIFSGVPPCPSLQTQTSKPAVKSCETTPFALVFPQVASDELVVFYDPAPTYQRLWDDLHGSGVVNAESLGTP